MRLNKIVLAALVLGGSALLSACGGGDGDSLPPPKVATADTSATINPSTGAAVVQSVLDKSFTFGAGVTNFGTTAATTLKLTGTGAAPQFAISSTEGTASGAMSFGSCIFTVSSSSFGTGPLAQGQTVTVSPCELSIATAGKPADGKEFTTNVVMVLGTQKSSPVSITVTISPSGTVTVNNSVVGTVTLVGATGATGGSN